MRGQRWRRPSNRHLLFPIAVFGGFLMRNGIYHNDPKIVCIINLLVFYRYMPIPRM